MTFDTQQTFIDENIPLAGKAGLTLELVSSECVLVSGRMEPNRNHHGSVFGGSISLFQIMAGWLLVQEIMKPVCPEASIVICRQEVDFLKPVCRDFIAEARVEKDLILEDFMALFNEKGKGRLEVKVQLREKNSDDCCALFTGLFHVKRRV